MSKDFGKKSSGVPLKHPRTQNVKVPGIKKPTPPVPDNSKK